MYLSYTDLFFFPLGSLSMRATCVGVSFILRALTYTSGRFHSEPEINDLP